MLEQVETKLEIQETKQLTLETKQLAMALETVLAMALEETSPKKLNPKCGFMQELLQLFYYFLLDVGGTKDNKLKLSTMITWDQKKEVIINKPQK